MTDANTKEKTASRSTRTRKIAAATEALAQALATASVCMGPPHIAIFTLT